MLQFIGFLRIKDTKRVQILGASNLKLNDIPAPLDFHRPRILPPCRQKEILNLVDLLRLYCVVHTHIKLRTLFIVFHTNKQTSYKSNQRRRKRNSSYHCGLRVVSDGGERTNLLGRLFNMYTMVSQFLLHKP